MVGRQGLQLACDAMHTSFELSGSVTWSCVCVEFVAERHAKVPTGPVLAFLPSIGLARPGLVRARTPEPAEGNMRTACIARHRCPSAAFRSKES